MQGHRGYVTQVTEMVRDTGKLMVAGVLLLFDFHPRCKLVLWSKKSSREREAVHFWKHLDIKRHYGIEISVRHPDLSWKYHSLSPEDA